jgi:hypothetical protein
MNAEIETMHKDLRNNSPCLKFSDSIWQGRVGRKNSKTNQEIKERKRNKL